MPPTMPRRRKQTSSTNTTPSTSFQAAPSSSVALQEVLQEQPDGGADQRAEQRAGAADRGLHHELARGVEHEGVGRHEGLHHAEQAAGEAGIGGGDDEGGELVAVDVVADARRRAAGCRGSRCRIAPTGERTMRSAMTMPMK